MSTPLTKKELRRGKRIRKEWGDLGHIDRQILETARDQGLAIREGLIFGMFFTESETLHYDKPFYNFWTYRIARSAKHADQYYVHALHHRPIETEKSHSEVVCELLERARERTRMCDDAPEEDYLRNERRGEFREVHSGNGIINVGYSPTKGDTEMSPRKKLAEMLRDYKVIAAEKAVRSLKQGGSCYGTTYNCLRELHKAILDHAISIGLSHQGQCTNGDRQWALDPDYTLPTIPEPLTGQAWIDTLEVGTIFTFLGDVYRVAVWDGIKQALFGPFPSASSEFTDEACEVYVEKGN